MINSSYPSNFRLVRSGTYPIQSTVLDCGGCGQFGGQLVVWTTWWTAVCVDNLVDSWLCGQLTVDRDMAGGAGGGGRVEDHPADSVHAHHGGALNKMHAVMYCTSITYIGFHCTALHSNICYYCIV